MSTIKVVMKPLACDEIGCEGGVYMALEVNAEDALDFPGGSGTLMLCQRHLRAKKDAIRAWAHNHGNGFDERTKR